MKSTFSLEISHENHPVNLTIALKNNSFIHFFLNLRMKSTFSFETPLENRSVNLKKKVIDSFIFRIGSVMGIDCNVNLKLMSHKTSYC